MTGHESVGHDEPGAAHHAAAEFKLAQEIHLARYPHHAHTDGGPDDDLEGVAQRAAAGLLGGLDDEPARARRTAISWRDCSGASANSLPSGRAWPAEA